MPTTRRRQLAPASPANHRSAPPSPRPSLGDPTHAAPRWFVAAAAPRPSVPPTRTCACRPPPRARVRSRPRRRHQTPATARAAPHRRTTAPANVATAVSQTRPSTRTHSQGTTTTRSRPRHVRAGTHPHRRARRQGPPPAACATHAGKTIGQERQPRPHSGALASRRQARRRLRAMPRPHQAPWT